MQGEGYYSRFMWAQMFLPAWKRCFPFNTVAEWVGVWTANLSWEQLIGTFLGSNLRLRCVCTVARKWCHIWPPGGRKYWFLTTGAGRHTPDYLSVLKSPSIPPNQTNPLKSRLKSRPWNHSDGQDRGDDHWSLKEGKSPSAVFSWRGPAWIVEAKYFIRETRSLVCKRVKYLSIFFFTLSRHKRSLLR